MWSQYDEDLSENDFFKNIKEQHEDIVKKACEEHWVICVPRRGSFSSAKFSMDVILDHILVPGADGIYHSVSKKALILDNHYLKQDKNGIFHNEIEILFEETHYLKDASKCWVWCINGPLFQHQNQNLKINNNNVILTSVQDCIDFLYSETYGYNLLEGIKGHCKDFWEHYEDIFATESLQGQKDYLGNLYSQCLQLCFKSDIIREKSIKNLTYLDNFKLSVETYMQYCLGKKLLFSTNTLNHLTDCMINKTIRNSSHIALSDLSIMNDFSEFVQNAQYELSRFNNFITVLDKINCLSRIFNMFTNKPLKNSGKSLHVTSDDFLQILVYLILKSNISNWLGNLVYIKEMQFSAFSNPSHVSFLVTTLEAAITFIKSSQFAEIRRMSKSSPLDLQLPLFENLYIKLNESGNFEELCSIMSDQMYIDRSALCHPLCSCAKCKKIVTCSSSNNPLHISNSLGQNFLIKATIENNRDYVEFLLTLPLNINFKDTFGKTALHYACEHGFQDTMFLLINFKANVNIFSNDRNTPLHLACDKGHENCVKGLIYSSHFVELNLQNNSGETPLFLATRWGYFDIVKILLENGASVCIKNNRNITAFKLSSNYYISKLFIEFGKHSSSKLLEEVKKCHNEDSSIEKNVEEKVCDEEEVDGSLLFGIQPKTASDLKQIHLLLKVIENNDMPLMCFYLGFSVNHKTVVKDHNIVKCHPLCSCSKCFQLIELEDSLGVNSSSNKNQKININMCNNDGITPLHSAAKYGRTEILRVLLDGGALLNVRTYKTLYTPLHLAVMFQRLQTVKELLQCGNCDIDAQDYKGNTPLHYACLSNNSNLQIVELLVKNGADCQKKNREDKTVLQVCEEKNLFRVCRILRENMGYSVEKSREVFGDCDKVAHDTREFL